MNDDYPFNEQPITKFFDHLRVDFAVEGIIIYNGNNNMQRVYIIGYPYYPYKAQNDNEAKR